jgi:hypothetical protein
LAAALSRIELGSAEEHAQWALILTELCKLTPEQRAPWRAPPATRCRWR